jgi:tetratricopeptide (TPR) repeat protein
MLSRFLITIGILAYGIAALFNGLDRISLDSPGVQAAVPGPFRAQADRSRADIAIARQAPAEALSASRAAVAHDPVDPDSAASLGTALLLSNDSDGAAKAFRVAAAFGWRNPATQAYWFEAALQARDFNVAVDRLDAILRVNPIYAGSNAMFAPLEADAAGRAALLNRLATRPPWIYRYLAIDEAVPLPQLQRRADIVASVAGSGHRLGCDAVYWFTVRLIQLGDRAHAMAVWNANCPRLAAGRGIVDPSFELADSAQPSPFGWSLRRSGDIGIVVEKAPGGGKELVLNNNGSNAEAALDQAVDIAPGTYRLSATVRGDQPADAGRLVAGLACDDAVPFPAQVEGSLAAGGQVIEARSCPSQRLALWLSPGSGAIRLDNIVLRRVSP